MRADTAPFREEFSLADGKEVPSGYQELSELLDRNELDGAPWKDTWPCLSLGFFHRLIPVRAA